MKIDVTWRNKPRYYTRTRKEEHNIYIIKLILEFFSNLWLNIVKINCRIFLQKLNFIIESIFMIIVIYISGTKNLWSTKMAIPLMNTCYQETKQKRGESIPEVWRPESTYRRRGSPTQKSIPHKKTSQERREKGGACQPIFYYQFYSRIIYYIFHIL